jgi:hypothetical protein
VSAPDLILIVDCYGGTHRVDAAQLEDKRRTQLTLYKANGVKVSTWLERMNWSGRGMCTTIHRENIARVLP